MDDLSFIFLSSSISRLATWGSSCLVCLYRTAWHHRCWAMSPINFLWVQNLRWKPLSLLRVCCVVTEAPVYAGVHQATRSWFMVIGGAATAVGFCLLGPVPFLHIPRWALGAVSVAYEAWNVNKARLYRCCVCLLQSAVAAGPDAGCNRVFSGHDCDPNVPWDPLMCMVSGFTRRSCSFLPCVTWGERSTPCPVVLAVS